MSKIIDKTNYTIMIFVVFLILLFFIDKLVFSLFSIDIIPFQYHNVLWWLIPILIFIYGYNIIKKNIKLGIFDYLIFILIILNVFVCIFSISISNSILGSIYRHEGFFSYLSYYLIFLNCRCINNKKNVKNILNIFIFVGILQFLYCFIQLFFRNILPSGFNSSISNNMASGFINNPNFLGSYIVLLLGFVMMKYLTRQKKYIVYFFLTMIFFINLIFTQSTGPFLGFVFMLIFSFIFLIIKKKLLVKRFLILFISLIAVHISVNYALNSNPSINNSIIGEYTINYDLKQIFRALTGQLKLSTPTTSQDNTKGETNSIATNNSSQNTINLSHEDDLDYLGSRRFFIWRKSLTLVPKYFWFGCGIDSFGKVYKWHDTTVYYDKAHNDYLQILITQGIFVLLVYLALLISIFKSGYKCNEPLVWSLLVGFVGYSVQSFTNISVVNVAPYFYMISGLLVSQTLKKSHNK